MRDTRLGPYEILDRLGAGGMGEVWLAKDTRLGRQVAVKVLPHEFAADPERLARFEQEARAAAALNHPHIAAVFDVGEAPAADGEGTTHFIVQEYLQGQTLRELIDDGRIPLRRALALTSEIAQALKAAHRAGIVHRDLKPENVFVTEDGHAKVLDFGLAKLTEVTAGSGPEATMSPTVLGTVAGQIMGTAGYMAPEQIDGRAVDRRTDVFAFGCVLFEIVCGRRAFSGTSLHETLHLIGHAPAPALKDVDPTLPHELQRILHKALAKDPEDRYQYADDLVVDLRALATEVDTGQASSGSPEHGPGGAVTTSGRRLTWAMAAIALAAVALAVWALSRAPGDAPQVTRLAISMPDLTISRTGDGRFMAIAPDGRSVIAQAVYEGEDVLLHRSFDAEEPRVLIPSDGALQDPTLSPDGEWVAFFNARHVTKMSVTQGTTPLRSQADGSIPRAAARARVARRARTA